MINNKCSVLINSCDKYEDAWGPFFKLAEKYWSNCPYKYYLNTETKSFSVDGLNVNILNVLDKGIRQPKTWGKRLKDCLKRIDSPYVIMLLEDFFFQRQVNQDEIERCIELMESDSRYTAIYFKQIDGFKTVSESESDYFDMSEKLMYKLNLQAGLWRKTDLESLICDEDSPWEFEFVGQDRLNGQDKLFLCSRAGTHFNMDGAVFPYLTGRSTGYGIWKGKWLWNNDKLLKANGIPTGDIKLQRFGKFDMLKYYWKRVKEVIGKRLFRK